MSASSSRKDSGNAWVLAATILASTMAFLDGSIVNVAIPVIQSQLHATSADMQWVVESYALVLAGCILAGGALGDRYGRRRIFAAGVIVFTLASAWCGFAPDVDHLIIARGFQGLGGALLTPGSLAILGAAFDGERRARAIGTWSSLTSIAGVAGPVAGGWISDHVSWRGIFFVNVPLAVVVLLVTWRHVAESRDDDGGTLDWIGAGFATTALAALVYAALESPQRGIGNPFIIAAALAAVLFGWAFFRRESSLERTGAHGISGSRVRPMLPLRLFRGRVFAGLNAYTFLLYSALSAFFWVPYDLVQVHGYSATLAGAALVPITVATFLIAPRSDVLVRKFGIAAVLTAGPLLVALGFSLFAGLDADNGYWRGVFPAALAVGLGLGLVVAPLTTSVLGAVEQAHVGMASGVNNAVARLSNVLALAAVAPLVAFIFNRALDGQLAAMRHDGMALSPRAQSALDAERSHLASASIPGDVSAPVRSALRTALMLATDHGYHVAMLTCAVLAASAGLIAFVLRSWLKAPATTSQKMPRKRDAPIS